MSAPLRLARGALHLPREVCAHHLGGRETVVLARQGVDLVVLPVHDPAAGGLLLKVRNAAGDRVVDAVELLRAHGLDEGPERLHPFRWDAAGGALIVEGVFAAAP